MKASRVSARLSLILILTLLVILFLPAAPVLASSPSIELDPEIGAAGSSVTVSGTNFKEDYYYYIFFDETYKTKGVIDDDGEFSKSFTVSSSTDDGTYEIAVFSKKSNDSSPDYDDDDWVYEAYADYKVTSDPVINVSPETVSPGDSVTVTGYNFDYGDYYYIFFDEDYKVKGSINSSGEFTKTFTISSSTDEGDYEIAVMTLEDSVSSPDYDDDDYLDTLTLEISVAEDNSVIYIDPEVGSAGTSVTIEGYDFTADYYYYIFFDETYKSRGAVDSDGEFSRSLSIPSSLSSGTYEIAVMSKSYADSSPEYDDDYVDVATADFEVTSDDTDIDLDPDSGTVGETFSISGTDFGIKKTVTIYWDGTKLGSTFTTDSSGEFDAETYSVPECVSGTHTVKAVDSALTYATATYTVTPDVTLSATTLESGDQIVVSGSGFSASSTLYFYLDGSMLTSRATSSTLGSLSDTSLVLTAGTSGSHVLKVQDSAGYSTSTTLTISTPAVVSTPAAVAPTQSPAAEKDQAPAPTTTQAQSNPVQNSAPDQNAAGAQDVKTGTSNNTPAGGAAQADSQPVTAAAQTPAQNQNTVNNAPVQSAAQAAAQPPQSNSDSSGSLPVWVIVIIVVLVVVLAGGVTYLLLHRRKA